MTRKQRSAQLNRQRAALSRNWRWHMVWTHRCRCEHCKRWGAA